MNYIGWCLLFLGTYYFYTMVMGPNIEHEAYGEIVVNGRVECRAYTSGAHWLEAAHCSAVTNLMKGDLVWVRSGNNGPYKYHTGFTRFSGLVISVQF